MKQEIADELYRRIERHITNESETRAVKTVLNNWAAEKSPLTEDDISVGSNCYHEDVFIDDYGRMWCNGCKRFIYR